MDWGTANTLPSHTNYGVCFSVVAVPVIAANGIVVVVVVVVFAFVVVYTTIAE